jgi:hypothetical protein
MKDLIQLMCFLGAIFVLILLPIAWFDGNAKSVYLKQVKGIEIPWHQATFLTVQINTVDATVESK